MKKLFAVLLMSAAMASAQQVIFNPGVGGVAPTVGYNPLYGYPVFNTGQLDANSNVIFAPIVGPDLSGFVTNDISGLSDYFTSSALNSSWATNVDFAASALALTNLGGSLVITDTGVDSTSSSFLVKTIPYPTNNWQARLVITGIGVPAMASNGMVCLTGLGCMIHTNSTYYGIDYAHVKYQTNAYSGVVEAAPYLWLNSCSGPTVARTNTTTTSGVTQIPYRQPQVALGLSYVASTGVLTFQAGCVVDGQILSPKTLDTITLPANPTNVVISLYENDSVGGAKSKTKRVIKSFQFNQPTQ